MLTRKDMKPICLYCENGTKLDEDHVSCLRHGVVSAGWNCRKFIYDPLKRTPPRPASIRKKYKKSDFSIE